MYMPEVPNSMAPEPRKQANLKHFMRCLEDELQRSRSSETDAKQQAARAVKAMGVETTRAKTAEEKAEFMVQQLP